MILNPRCSHCRPTYPSKTEIELKQEIEMSNPFDEVRTAVSNAESQLQAADSAALSMAQLLVGRLRHVQSSGHWAGTSALRKLKKELRDFDMTTGEWK
jgi:hypothetical protein